MTHAFVTGATGLVGRWLVPELTRRGQVTVLLRRAHERSAEYRAWVAEHGGRVDALAFVDGDLAAPGLGLASVDRARVLTATEIYASGALMQFGMDAEVARRANVLGMGALVDLALEAGVRRFVHVGGYKIGEAGAFERHGITHDGPYDPATYAPYYRTLGAYEASKLEADHLVRDAARVRGLPLVSIHPGGVIGDSRTGETTQFVGFAPLVEAIYRGKLPAIPGGARHWLPLVTVDFLASFIASAAIDPHSTGGTYMLLDDRTPLLAELVHRIAERIGVPAPRRRVPIGLLEVLRRAKLVPGASASSEELAFLSDERHDVHPTKELAARAGLVWPDITAAIDRAVDYLVAARFGKTPPRRDAVLERVAGSRTFVRGERREPERVLLHGLPLDADSWDAVDDRLPGRSLRADLPGLARSAPILARPGEWVASLLAGLARPPLVVAHSLGTWFALEYAHAQPARVAGLVLISPFFLQGKPPPFMRVKMMARGAGRMMQRRHLEQLVAGDKRAKTPVLDGPASDLGRAGAGARFGEWLARAHAARPQLQQILAEVASRVPTLVIYGARDPLVEAVPAGVRVIEIPDTGHFPQLDRAELVAELIGEVHGSCATPHAA